MAELLTPPVGGFGEGGVDGGGGDDASARYTTGGMAEVGDKSARSRPSQVNWSLVVRHPVCVALLAAAAT